MPCSSFPPDAYLNPCFKYSSRTHACFVHQICFAAAASVTAAAAAATFVFQNPAIFEASSEMGDITGLYMNDDEGQIAVRGWAGRQRAPLGCSTPLRPASVIRLPQLSLPLTRPAPPPPLPLPPLQTVDVQAKFVNGKPSSIEVKYVMRSTFEWDRFMRFMERYAEDQGLGFQKS